jgi:glycine cleavage system H protein
MSFQMHALDEIVYMELHSGEGDSVAAGEPCGEIESTRSVSDIYATVTGEITAINPAVIDQPKVINDDPYGQGWISSRSGWRASPPTCSTRSPTES